ncbi:MAG: hypothetical protein GQ532_03740 [Methylomarinum sp.]|nr:hypothetical protein [Methylococcales bacterium]NOR68799.1 hypothetical protein [Methylomarinum sp.]
MTGNLIELFIIMLVIACLAFAPLGYFIYMYTKKNGEPFGDTEPHGDSESKIIDLAELVISKVKGLLGKK